MFNGHLVRSGAALNSLRPLPRHYTSLKFMTDYIYYGLDLLGMKFSRHENQCVVSRFSSLAPCPQIFASLFSCFLPSPCLLMLQGHPKFNIIYIAPLFRLYFCAHSIFGTYITSGMAITQSCIRFRHFFFHRPATG